MMRIRILAAVVIALATSAAYAQIPPLLQTISAQDAGVACSVSGSCASWSLPNQPTVTIQISGSCSCTLTFESTSDGQTWFSVAATNLSTGAATTTTTTTGQYSLANTGVVSVRVRATTFSSGGLNLKAQQGWSSLARSGGGGGTPGGVSGDLQYNNSGSFGGYTPGAGVATFIQTPTSANLRTAITDPTGTGVAVFATTPTFTTSIIDPLVIGGSAVSSTLTLQSTSGVGSSDAIIFQTGSQSTRWQVNTSGHILAGTDNTYDIGASGATRPRTVYAGTTVIVPQLTSTTLQSATDGNTKWVFSGSGLLGQYSAVVHQAFSGSGITNNATDVISFYTSGGSGGNDVGIARNAAGILEVNNATRGSLSDIRTRHYLGGGTAPAVSNTSANSCGTSAATLVGQDMAGKVTVGATSGSSCTITFNVAWTNAPSCTAVDETTAGGVTKTITTTTTAIVSGAFVAGDVLAYQCFGY